MVDEKLNEKFYSKSQKVIKPIQRWYHFWNSCPIPWFWNIQWNTCTFIQNQPIEALYLEFQYNEVVFKFFSWEKYFILHYRWVKILKQTRPIPHVPALSSPNAPSTAMSSISAGRSAMYCSDSSIGSGSAFISKAWVLDPEGTTDVCEKTYWYYIQCLNI